MIAALKDSVSQNVLFRVQNAINLKKNFAFVLSQITVRDQSIVN